MSGTENAQVVIFQDLTPGLTVEDEVLEDVKAIWRKIMGEEEKADERGEERFMVFENRKSHEEEDEEDEVSGGS